MITVSVFRENDYIEAFELSGHAESGPKGHDLVCAGVSAVSFGSINAVHALCKVKLEINQANDGGFLRVTVPTLDNQELIDQIQLLLEGMLISLETIEREYGEYIKIKQM